MEGGVDEEGEGRGAGERGKGGRGKAVSGCRWGVVLED